MWETLHQSFQHNCGVDTVSDSSGSKHFQTLGPNPKVCHKVLPNFLIVIFSHILTRPKLYKWTFEGPE